MQRDKRTGPFYPKLKAAAFFMQKERTNKCKAAAGFLLEEDVSHPSHGQTKGWRWTCLGAAPPSPEQDRSAKTHSEISPSPMFFFNGYSNLLAGPT